MKKYFYFIIMLTALFSFSACKKSNDITPAPTLTLALGNISYGAVNSCSGSTGTPNTVSFTITDASGLLQANTWQLFEQVGAQPVSQIVATLSGNTISFSGCLTFGPLTSLSANYYIVCKGVTSNTVAATYNKPTNPAAGVYVSGWESNGTKGVAKYWKDGTAVSLTNGTQNAYANTVFVAGTDVYAGGYENNGTKNVAKVWKNGVATSLTNGTNDGFIACVFVSGTDVYAVGWENNAGANDIAKIWKNGVATQLSTALTNNSRAFSVRVYGTDVYVAGFENNGPGTKAIAKYWKNGTATSLTDGTRVAIGGDVFVNGADVYVCGNEGNGTVGQAKYWKNGTAISLPVTSTTTTSFICGIALVGTDVVAAGTDAGKPISWKNATPTAFANAGDLSWQFVLNTDVYLAGYEGSGITKAVVWKNGTATSLTNGTNNAAATGVFVIQ
jgi:hypothetical protein